MTRIGELDARFRAAALPVLFAIGFGARDASSQELQQPPRGTQEPSPQSVPWRPPYWRPPSTRIVRFTATDPRAELQLYQKGWFEVCRAPCTVSARIGIVYRVSGDGVSTSKKFTMPAGPDPLLLHANARSPVGPTLSILMTVVGGLAVLGGTLAVVEGGCAFCSDRTAEQERAEIAGSIAIAAGGGLLAGGIVLFVHSKTNLVFSSVRASAVPQVRIGPSVGLSQSGIAFW